MGAGVGSERKEGEVEMTLEKSQTVRELRK